MPAQSGFQHHFDLCDQHRIAGWTTAPSLIVAINDGPVARIVPDLSRPDLAEAGIGPGHGFAFILPRPLWTDDDVSVHAEDGTGARTRLGFAAAQRVADLTRHADPARRIGLEIGPLDRPVVPKGRFRIYTLDQAPRRGLQLRFGGAGEPMTLLEEPGFVLGEGSFLDAVGDRRFDYAIASHVIEHVPDMIGWLWQVWSVLNDGAVLSLAVPHAEKIFDAHRQRTTLADLLDPYFGRAVRPGARQIVDAALGSALFYGIDVLQAAFDAFHRANHARKAGLYLDTHCSVFTPESFADTLRCLDRCELLGFDLPDIVYRGNDEFIAHLVKRAHKTLPDHISP